MVEFADGRATHSSPVAVDWHRSHRPQHWGYVHTRTPGQSLPSRDGLCMAEHRAGVKALCALWCTYVVLLSPSSSRRNSHAVDARLFRV